MRPFEVVKVRTGHCIRVPRGYVALLLPRTELDNGDDGGETYQKINVENQSWGREPSQEMVINVRLITNQLRDYEVQEGEPIARIQVRRTGELEKYQGNVISSEA